MFSPNAYPITCPQDMFTSATHDMILIPLCLALLHSLTRISHRTSRPRKRRDSRNYLGCWNAVSSRFCDASDWKANKQWQAVRDFIWGRYSQTCRKALKRGRPCNVDFGLQCHLKILVVTPLSSWSLTRISLKWRCAKKNICDLLRVNLVVAV